MKKTIVIILTCLVLSPIALYLMIFGFPWVLMSIQCLGNPAPPAPEIKYGEFSYHLEYKVNGELFVIDDVLKCRYVGVGFEGDGRKVRRWKSSSKNTEGSLILLVKDGYDHVYMDIGSADYYLGEFTLSSPNVPGVFMERNRELLSKEEIMDKYKIELIYWKADNPIKNKFE